MTRISTFGNYTLALAHMGEAQARQIQAGQQISSQKIAKDLKGFSGKSESIISMRALQARLNGLLSQNTVLQDRFTTQDIALNQLADSADGVRQAIADTLASGRADTFMQEIRGFFSTASAALNMKSQGRYIFAGGQIHTQPVSATALSDLTLAPVAGYFHNDGFMITNQIDETSTVEGGMLASNLGVDLFESFRAIQAFEEGVDGPFGGELSDNQRAFLEGLISSFESHHKNLVNEQARNGSLIKRLENAKLDLQARSDTLEGLLGKITDADLPRAISNLEAAQFAVQASAQVFNTLRQSSLLNYLKL